MTSKKRTWYIDSTINSAIASLPTPEQQKIEDSAEKLASQIGNLRGGRGFGKVRSKELMFAVAAFLNSNSNEGV